MENKKVSPSQIKATKKYLERNDLVEIKFRVTRPQRESIQAHAKEQKESTNAFITRAIDETMARDNEKPLSI